MKKLAFLLAFSFFLWSCTQATKTSSGRRIVLTVFHAGSLTVPFRALADSFMLMHPEVSFRMEAAGSVETMRKITELGRETDLVASADERLIREMLVPEHAGWSLPFAGNEMVLAFTQKSAYSTEINELNWTEVLSREGVSTGRSNPDLDPCGYRTLIVLQLAERFYNKPGFADKMLDASAMNVRPKETDLTALLQTGHLDYIFTYRSVAVQHQLAFVGLPAQINLSDRDLSELYGKFYTEIKGRRPEAKIIIRGEPITYGLTILHHSVNKEAAARFVAFMLSPVGQEILSHYGHIPLQNSLLTKQNIPEEVKKYLAE